MSEHQPERGIREWRARRFLTQDELAAKVGVSVNTISNWETGAKAPRIRALRRLADALGISPEQIILPPKTPRKKRGASGGIVPAAA